MDSWRPFVTQLSAEVLGKQDILCINRNNWLSQKIGLNSIKTIPGMEIILEMIECLLGFCRNLRGIYSLSRAIRVHLCLMTAS